MYSLSWWFNTHSISLYYWQDNVSEDWDMDVYHWKCATKLYRNEWAHFVFILCTWSLFVTFCDMSCSTADLCWPESPSCRQLNLMFIFELIVHIIPYFELISSYTVYTNGYKNLLTWWYQFWSWILWVLYLYRIIEAKQFSLCTSTELW